MEMLPHDLDNKQLLELISSFGYPKASRTGVHTSTIFGAMSRFDIRNGRVPLLTTKDVDVKAIIHELLWMLSGDTNIRYLKANGVNIWDSWIRPGTEEYVPLTDDEIIRKIAKNPGDTPVQFQQNDQVEPGEFTTEMVDRDGYHCVEKVVLISYSDSKALRKAYLEHFGEAPLKLSGGDLPKIYQHQWRHWEDTRVVAEDEVESYEAKGYEVLGPIIQVENMEHNLAPNYVVRREIDQVQRVVDQLLNNPDDRGIILSAWNVAQLDEMALRPCHTLAQFMTRELSIRERKQVFDRMVDQGHEVDTWVSDQESLIDFLDRHNVPKRAISSLLYMRKQSCALSA